MILSFGVLNLNVLGIHAREWIADSMGTYLINELTKPDRDNDIIEHLNILRIYYYDQLQHTLHIFLLRNTVVKIYKA